MTHDTFGLPGFGSSRSADLQRALVSKCQALLESSGSTLYAMTWTLVDTPSPPSISRLAASALRTSGSGCGGWATQQASDDTEGSRTAIDSRQKCLGRDLKMMTGWATPRANDGTGGQVPPGREGGVALKTQAGWATPCTADMKGPSGPNGQAVSRGHYARLADQVAGWPTATTADAVGARNASSSRKPGSRHSEGTTLTDAAWSTRGPISPGSSVPTDEQGRSLRLNPRFSLWLQGYPAEWDACAPTGTRSRRR